MNITENFLHFIWRFRLYRSQDLHTSQIEVLNTGIINKNAGPDFNHAKIRIHGTVWAGNVEVHIKSSDWLLHGHQNDEAYDNVILHVVYEDDLTVTRKDGTVIPVLVLKGLFPSGLLDRYLLLISSSNSFPCEKQIAEVDPLLINGFLSRVMIERFEQKGVEVQQILNRTKGNWNETFYICLARNFGFKVNALPFELLAASVGTRILAKHKDRPKQIEAMIFGQAGFLNQDFEDAYASELKIEYFFLSTKYRLQPVNVSLWKFLRMRPQNFPTIRLAQFAALIIKSNHLFSSILQITDLKDLYALFEHLPVNKYWKEHYHFNKKTDRVNVQLGRYSVSNILINTVCLMLFAYGRLTDEQQYIERAVYFLENIPAEKNSIISLYEACGVKIDNAYLSQALLQLNKNYCTGKKCLNCNIGIKILKK